MFVTASLEPSACPFPAAVVAPQPDAKRLPIARTAPKIGLRPASRTGADPIRLGTMRACVMVVRDANP
jgi:hypothetical protein